MQYNFRINIHLTIRPGNLKFNLSDENQIQKNFDIIPKFQLVYWGKWC